MMLEFISWLTGVAEKNETKGVGVDGTEGVGGVCSKNGNKASLTPQVAPVSDFSAFRAVDSKTLNAVPAEKEDQSGSGKNILGLNRPLSSVSVFSAYKAVDLESRPVSQTKFSRGNIMTDSSGNGEDVYQHRELTDAIICCFYTVYNTLGFGFLEKVYVNALLVEFGKRNIAATAQCPIAVYYGEISVGDYFADILVENTVIIEVKAVKSLSQEHEAQLLNYLRATEIEVGLLLNFGPQPQVKRRSFDNTRKGHF